MNSENLFFINIPGEFMHTHFGTHWPGLSGPPSGSSNRVRKKVSEAVLRVRWGQVMVSHSISSHAVSLAQLGLKVTLAFQSASGLTANSRHTKHFSKQIRFTIFIKNCFTCVTLNFQFRLSQTSNDIRRNFKRQVCVASGEVKHSSILCLLDVGNTYLHPFFPSNPEGLGLAVAWSAITSAIWCSSLARTSATFT